LTSHRLLVPVRSAAGSPRVNCAFPSRRLPAPVVHHAASYARPTSPSRELMRISCARSHNVPTQKRFGPPKRFRSPSIINPYSPSESEADVFAATGHHEKGMDLSLTERFAKLLNSLGYRAPPHTRCSLRTVQGKGHIVAPLPAEQSILRIGARVVMCREIVQGPVSESLSGSCRLSDVGF
jgi:hypothetical protein